MNPEHVARIIERLDPADRDALEQHLNDANNEVRALRAHQYQQDLSLKEARAVINELEQQHKKQLQDDYDTWGDITSALGHTRGSLLREQIAGAIRALVAANHDLTNRNAFLRQRPDLPADRIAAYKEVMGSMDALNSQHQSLLRTHQDLLALRNRCGVDMEHALRGHVREGAWQPDDTLQRVAQLAKAETTLRAALNQAIELLVTGLHEPEQITPPEIHELRTMEINCRFADREYKDNQ